MSRLDSPNEEFLWERYQNLKKKERYLKVINDFTFNLHDLYTIEEIVWGIAKNVIAQIGFPDCVVYLVDEEQNLLVQKAAHGSKNPEKFDIYNPITIPIGEGIVGTVAATGIAEIIQDTRKDSRYIEDDALRLSEIAVPISYEDKVIGVIDSEHPNPHFYTEEHLEILKTIASLSATKIMHARALDEIASYQNELEKQISLKTSELEETVRNLKRSNYDLEQFAYAASHDMKEPLRTISNYLQLIQRREGDKLSAETTEYLDFAIDGAKRMNTLLSGLLAYSRLKNSDFEWAEIDLNDVIENITANLYATIKKNNAVVNGENLHTIRGNRTQIIQLFQNLIANAIKFHKEGEPPCIKITSTAADKHIIVRVEDKGIGIEPDYHDKIFSLFSRLNPIGTYEGSGIGLALCKRIMDYHGGKISVSSEKDKGTIFILSFSVVS